MSSRPSRGAARLAAILDALPDGLVLVNCNGTVVNANTIALELFEAPGTALVGRGLLDLLPAFDSRLIPGSMRRPEAAGPRGRTKPTRMTARRTDGSEFPVEVTSASLEDGREAYDAQHSLYTGDELLMLVVRDLSGTVDTEAELARSQRQTEMILRAAAEGVVGTDTEGRVVLVNPAAAQILGFRASDLGGQELHPLVLHSREDGKPFPYPESPLADTLRSGRKHRVRGQVLWAKNGSRVPVDLTTSPVRDGDQLVGAVMTFTDRRPIEKLVEQHAAELTGTTERLTTELEQAREEHAAELADKAERYTVEIEGRDERFLALAGRQEQLTAVLGDALRGPLEELRAELGTLAADPAGQLWPEANQILHHLAAGYSRMTTLIDNVLGFQRLDAGAEPLAKSKSLFDAVVTAGVEGAVELIGPGRVQFAVHAPPIEAEVDAGRLATALAHLIADVAGVDSTGKTRPAAAPEAGPGGAAAGVDGAGGAAGGGAAGGGGAAYVDSTVVVAAAQRGEVVRLEVRGPFPGGDPVHQPIVRGIVAAHGGVVQTHEVPGMSGSAYVVEVPLGEGAGAVVAAAPATGRELELPAGQGAGREAGRDAGQAVRQGGQQAVRQGGQPGNQQAGQQDGQRAGQQEGRQGGGGQQGVQGRALALPEQASGDPAPGGGRRRARRGSTDAFLASPLEAEPTAGEGGAGGDGGPEGGTGRRRGRPSPAEGNVPAEGAVVSAAESAAQAGRPALGQAVPPQGVPAGAGTGDGAGAPGGAGGAGGAGAPGGGRRARHSGVPELPAGPGGAGAPGVPGGPGVPGAAGGPGGGQVPVPPQGAAPQPVPPQVPVLPQAPVPPQVPVPPQGVAPQPVPPRGAAPVPAPVPAQAQAPVPAEAAAGRRARRALAPAPAEGPAPQAAARPPFALSAGDAAQHETARTGPGADDFTPPQPHPVVPPGPTGRRRARREIEGQGVQEVQGSQGSQEGQPTEDTAPAPAPAPAAGQARAPQAADVRSLEQGPRSLSQPLPAEAPMPADASQGRAFSVRTLGQGVPFTPNQGQGQGQVQNQAPGQNQAPAPAPGQAQAPSSGSGRRRKLATPPAEDRPEPSTTAPAAPPQPNGHTQSALRLPAPGEREREEQGRAYAIGAPDEGAAEGPEPLDGPGGAVEVTNRPHPQPVDDELPPEPLDNPRRLLVWPAPDVSTQQALSERGYRPVVVHSREEVDAQIAAFPAALFVDPLTGPITRTALQSLRQAAVAAEVPVLVTAGLGQATREAAYGADPAVLLKALAPRDSEQHPSRVLLIEEHEEIALALTEALERRGLQVSRAAADADAVSLASQMRPNLVVMDLMQVRRRRAGIIDWLRANGQLNRTPLVVYTSAGLNRAELPRLSSGETVLFLAERSTNAEVQSRIVDLLAKIGTN
ncbi:PAS domain-containing protein [Streptomyces sp. NPDC017979]|uniref:PAS domain-containing protein n=1 Tax=Streptomyces sp. NPDC017979 TaxID=3365024 RepID=UPI00378BF780